MSREEITSYIKEALQAHERVLADVLIQEALEKAIATLKESFEKGNALLVAGNGGSAADAQHFAGEIVAQYKRKRKGYPAIALTTDTSVLTAWSNDIGFDSLFARQVEAHGKPGDVFVGISTSGNSKNIIEAIEKAKAMGIKTICFLGRDGGKLKGMSDIEIIVPSDNTPRIQEIHTLFLHIISEEVEKSFI